MSSDDGIQIIQIGDAGEVRTISIRDAEIVDGVEIPGGGGGTPFGGYLHVQSIAQAVWQVNHNLNRTPTAWSLFDEDGRECGQYVVQHIDNLNLLVAMDVPTAGSFRCI